MVKNSEFMSLLLSGSDGFGWVCAFTGNPGNDKDARWYGRPWAPSPQSLEYVDGLDHANAYFCVAELKETEPGRRSRTKANFKRLRALVGDDTVDGALMGTPTWILETSPGKVQSGVMIDPTDPDAADPALVDAVKQRMYELKLMGDISGNNSVRYVRLPNGLNMKPRESGNFSHRMLVWNPGQVLSLADACAVFGMDLDELRSRVKPVATDAIIFGDVGQDQLMAECMHSVINNVDYHESLNRIGASLSASGMHPGAQVNFLRGLMSSCQSPRKDTWQDRYNDIPRAVETGWKKFGKPLIEPLAAPGEDKDKTPLLLRYGDMSDSLDPPEWLVRGWLEAGCMSMLYGPSGTGKSFATLDMACCVASGTRWRGHEVKQGPVVIVVGEGQGGIKRRIRAWEQKTGISLKGAPLYVTSKSVQFLNPAAAAELVAAVDGVVATMEGEMPALVAIDTLARNFGPGDENSTEDATAFVECLDAHIRRRYGCHVLLVHHTGKDSSAGARGSSVFRAAMDQEFSISPKAYGQVIQLEGKKMKDGPIPKPLNFRLEIIVLGEDWYGEDITSAYLDSVTSEWDEIIIEKATLKVTVGQVLDLRDGDVAPSQGRIAEAFGVSRKLGETAYGRLKDRGLLDDAVTHATARKKLSAKAMKLLSDAGRLLGSGQEQADGGDA